MPRFPAMNYWSPQADPHHPRLGTRPERYALCLEGGGPFLTIVGHDQKIGEVAQAEAAYLFHTQEGAVRAARDLKAMADRAINVVKVL